MDGEGRKYKNEKETKNWKQMVRFHISPGRLLGDSILAVHPARAPAHGFPRIPTLRPPTSPARCGRLRTGSLWPRVERRAGRWDPGGAEGCAFGQARGGRPGGRKGEKARVAGEKKKNPWLGAKWWTTQGDVMKAADSMNATQFQPTGGAALSAHEPTRLWHNSVRSAARWRSAATQRVPGARGRGREAGS